LEKKCPINNLEKRLIKMGILDRKGLETINTQVISIVSTAVKYAVESPFPNSEDVLDDIFSP
jgi:TPP-dependent pyruvate/acetoin dehydrogenase alpha subunit